MIISGYLKLIVLNILVAPVIMVRASHKSMSKRYDCDTTETCVYKHQIPDTFHQQEFEDDTVFPGPLHEGLKWRTGRSVLVELVLRKKTKKEDGKTKRQSKTTSQKISEMLKLKSDINMSIFQTMEEEFRRRIAGKYGPQTQLKNVTATDWLGCSSRNDNMSYWIRYKNYGDSDWTRLKSNNLDYGFPNIQKELDKIMEGDYIPPRIIEIGGEHSLYDDDIEFEDQRKKMQNKIIDWHEYSRTIHEPNDPLVSIGTISKPYTLYLVILLTLI